MLVDPVREGSCFLVESEREMGAALSAGAPSMSEAEIRERMGVFFDSEAKREFDEECHESASETPTTRVSVSRARTYADKVGFLGVDALLFGNLAKLRESREKLAACYKYNFQGEIRKIKAWPTAKDGSACDVDDGRRFAHASSGEEAIRFHSSERLWNVALHGWEERKAEAALRELIAPFGADEAEVALLKRYTQLLTLPRYTQLWRKGARMSSFYVLIRGRVRLSGRLLFWLCRGVRWRLRRQGCRRTRRLACACSIWNDWSVRGEAVCNSLWLRLPSRGCLAIDTGV